MREVDDVEMWNIFLVGDRFRGDNCGGTGVWRKEDVRVGLVYNDFFRLWCKGGAKSSLTRITRKGIESASFPSIFY